MSRSATRESTREEEDRFWKYIADHPRSPHGQLGELIARVRGPRSIELGVICDFDNDGKSQRPVCRVYIRPPHDPSQRKDTHVLRVLGDGEIYVVWNPTKVGESLGPAVRRAFESITKDSEKLDGSWLKDVDGWFAADVERRLHDAASSV